MLKGTLSSRSILTEENCPVPFTRKFFPVFPYKRKALLDQVESAILEVSRGLSHMPLRLIKMAAEELLGGRVECSSGGIHSVFSLENVLKSVSNDFHG